MKSIMIIRHLLLLPIMGIACLALAVPSARAQADNDDAEAPSAHALKSTQKKLLTSLNKEPGTGAPMSPIVYVIRDSDEIQVSGIGATEKVHPGDTIVIKAALTWFKKKTPPAKTGDWLALPKKPLDLFIDGKLVPPPKNTGSKGFARFTYKVPMGTPDRTKLEIKVTFDGDGEYAKASPAGKASIMIFAP